MKHRGQRGPAAGFTLIELLIVVAIILVIVAIAIPNFLQSRMAANETGAAQAMRTLYTSAVIYHNTYQNGFPPDLATLGPIPGTTGAQGTCQNAGLVDPLLAGGFRAGYIYTYNPGPPLPLAATGCTQPGVTTFTINSAPTDYNRTGRKYFFMDDRGTIRYNMLGPAGPTDPPIPTA